jgi:hypothetical protein
MRARGPVYRDAVLFAYGDIFGFFSPGQLQEPSGSTPRSWLCPATSDRIWARPDGIGPPASPIYGPAAARLERSVVVDPDGRVDGGEG